MTGGQQSHGQCCDGALCPGRRLRNKAGSGGAGKGKRGSAGHPSGQCGVSPIKDPQRSLRKHSRFISPEDKRISVFMHLFTKKEKKVILNVSALLSAPQDQRIFIEMKFPS